MTRIAIFHVLLPMFTATYCVSAGGSECVLDEAARGASVSHCFHGRFSLSESAESEHEVNSLQLLQLRGGTFRVAPVCGILWFYHIPKTGGSSVKAWLDGLKKEGALDGVIELKGSRVGFGDGPHFDRDDHSVINFTAFNEEKIRPVIQNMKGKLLAVHHHHKGPGLYGMDSYFSDMKKTLSSQGCSLIRFTVLREPVSRLTSAINYDAQIIEKSLQNRSARDDFFRQHLEYTGESWQTRQDNSEVRYILNNFEGGSFPMPVGGSHEDALRAAEAILDGFEVVGLMEELATGIGKLAELLKLPNAEVPYRNERVGSYQKYDDHPLPDDLQALIIEYTKFDSELYNRFKFRLSE